MLQSCISRKIATGGAQCSVLQSNVSNTEINAEQTKLEAEALQARFVLFAQGQLQWFIVDVTGYGCNW